VPLNEFGEITRNVSRFFWRLQRSRKKSPNTQKYIMASSNGSSSNYIELFPLQIEIIAIKVN